MENTNQKPVTLDDLAVMVADGFNGLGSRMDNLGGRMDNLEGRMEGLEGRMDELGGRMEGLEGRMDNIENSVSGLRSSVNRYLELSDDRYIELKHRDRLIANWVKTVADKTGVPVDLGQLEKIL